MPQQGNGAEHQKNDECVQARILMNSRQMALREAHLSRVGGVITGTPGESTRLRVGQSWLIGRGRLAVSEAAHQPGPDSHELPAWTRRW